MRQTLLRSEQVESVELSGTHMTALHVTELRSCKHAAAVDDCVGVAL